MKKATLIPVLTGTMGDRSVQLIDARLLHQFLEVGRDFTNWIKGRINEYGFEAGKDYSLAKSGEQPPHLGGRRTVLRTDYLLTLDMAKELAMVERSPRGRQARRYFIECERQLKAMSYQGTVAPVVALQHGFPLAIDLMTADIHSVNRQAWADVAGDTAARFHARREELLRQQRQMQTHVEAHASMDLCRPSWAQ